MEEQVREAIIAELTRQAEVRAGELTVTPGDDLLTITGTVDVDELVMAVIGSVAGGP